jgi:RHS repeat-associated protein
MIQMFDRIGGGVVHYQYDAGKQRTRKVCEKGGEKAWERIYLGGMEIYRLYVGKELVEETESHHVFEGEHRVLLVEDVVFIKPIVPKAALYRYQYGNHLGSACLELDAAANVITYEEYHPYGTSAYRMARNDAEAPKRYRYTGMERDEESGLSYHTARYYVPWLGRWGSADPEGLIDGLNLYAYVRVNPLQLKDKTGTQAEDASSLVDGLKEAWKQYNWYLNDLDARQAEYDHRAEQIASSWDKETGDSGWWWHFYRREYVKGEIGSRPVSVNVQVAWTYAMFRLGRGEQPKLTTSVPVMASSPTREVQRAWVEASLAEQRASHTIETRSALRANRAEKIAEDFSELARGVEFGADVTPRELSKQLGPVSTTAVHGRSSDPLAGHTGLNVQRGKGFPPTAAEMGQLRSNLHPVLLARLDRLERILADARSSGDVTAAMTRAGVPGTHSEIVALNKSIGDWERQMGRAFTESDFSEFTLVNRNLQASFPSAPPPCFNCSYMTAGVNWGH